MKRYVLLAIMIAAIFGVEELVKRLRPDDGARMIATFRMSLRLIFLALFVWYMVCVHGKYGLHPGP
jgi:hypothetical protein